MLQAHLYCSLSLSASVSSSQIYGMLLRVYPLLELRVIWKLTVIAGSLLVLSTAFDIINETVSYAVKKPENL
jgi:hypothetical protein